MPSKRTMVIATAGECCISFRTVRWNRKSPQRFLIVREWLETLEDGRAEIVSDIHSFAVLRRSEATGLLTINFTWLNGVCGGEVRGWEESVTIPYAPLLAFMEESAQDAGPKTWKHLSVCSTSRPRLVFHDKGRLRDNFHSPCVERIDFYHDFVPYSFFFREVCNGRNGICGGLIFHNYHDNLKKANYSVHT